MSICYGTKTYLVNKVDQTICVLINYDSRNSSTNSLFDWMRTCRSLDHFINIGNFSGAKRSPLGSEKICSVLRDWPFTFHPKSRLCRFQIQFDNSPTPFSGNIYFFLNNGRANKKTSLDKNTSCQIFSDKQQLN
ncbi:hypothetical protein BpHYR1_011348 [Brachionus plicatilis]|uniref:Uncharacterized protein n=1 Tax=Brachionus plicatilis TaxID=10195 RepID=A0A3M7SLT0_BRAPC|nr:hypothetical protein BpHYR1_011348 [Brachionus plicatilis]